MSTAQLADRIAALSAKFLDELAANRTELSTLLSAPDERLLLLTHSIAGRAGTFGHPDLSLAAIRVHDLLEAGTTNLGDAAPALLDAISQVLDPPRR
jgi:HPt (histidine-containing phosphotransfer) domain-containing protein